MGHFVQSEKDND